MSSGQLSPVSYLILGLISRGATTPYELEQRVSRSVGNFWTFPHSQFYSEPTRLVRLGLLEEEREQEGRRRRTYTITDAGYGALTDWVREPTSEAPQVRDVGLLKLFFGDVLTADDLVAIARAQEQVHRDRLATYEAVERKLAPDARRTAFPRATLRMGLLMERAFIEFWSDLAANPPSGS